MNSLFDKSCNAAELAGLRPPDVSTDSAGKFAVSPLIRRTPPRGRKDVRGALTDGEGGDRRRLRQFTCDCLCGGTVDAADSKSAIRKGVGVRVPPGAPFLIARGRPPTHRAKFGCAMPTAKSSRGFVARVALPTRFGQTMSSVHRPSHNRALWGHFPHPECCMRCAIG